VYHTIVTYLHIIVVSKHVKEFLEVWYSSHYDWFTAIHG